MRRGDGSSENIIFELGTFARLGSISRAFKKLEALTFIALIFLLLKHLRWVSSSGLKDLHSIETFTESVHLARHQKKPQPSEPKKLSLSEKLRTALATTSASNPWDAELMAQEN